MSAIYEHDCVRLTAAHTGPDVFGDAGTVTVPAGAEGCAICAYEDACMVEFDNNVVLTVPHNQLIKYWDVATQKFVA